MKMKKLLVTLLLGAGLLSVTSAEELYCKSTSSNQCCIDFQDMQVALINSPDHLIYTTNNYSIFSMDPQLVNDGFHDSNCKNWDEYIIEYSWYNGLFEWKPGAWESTIKFLSN